MESTSRVLSSRRHLGDQPRATTKNGRGPSVAAGAGAEAAALIVESAITRTLAAAATDAADAYEVDGNTTAEVQVVCRRRRAADLLHKYESVDETNLLPSHPVQQAARETFIETEALHYGRKKKKKSLVV